MTDDSQLNSKNEGKATKEKNEFIHIVSNILEEIVIETENLMSNDHLIENEIKVFNASKVPKVKIEDYLKRIMDFSRCEENTVISALILIDTICENHCFLLSKLNYHRVLLVSIIISIKFHEDTCFSNQLYSKIGGISLTQLNVLEIEFLKLIGFNAYVKEKEFNGYFLYIQKQITELTIGRIEKMSISQRNREEDCMKIEVKEDE